ncbi:MAG: AAA family ATPase [Actinomycetota bacterium]|nr:AAA family ATPase [Actinomycetota bacterium]
MARCAECGQQNPDEARFCFACGSAIRAEATSSREVRKTVTVVFADVSGSTAIGERLDPESLRRVMARYFEEMRRVLDRHGGTIEKFIGDAVMAVFGIPVVHEDDALRAVRAAVEMREALAALNEELRGSWGVELAVRIGVNTGEVVAGDHAESQSFVAGDAVNVAARLEQAAGTGEIWIGEATYRLVRDAVRVDTPASLRLRGKEHEVPAHRLLTVASGSPGIARRLDSALVGREHERRLLDEVFSRAVRERACHLFTILGPAGVGKSRLIEEFLRSARDRARVVRGRCLPYGEGITFWPVIEAVKDAAGLVGEDSPDEVRRHVRALLDDEAGPVAERLLEAIGLSGAPVGGEETFWAVRKFLEALARPTPLVAVFDDVHWGEPTFLDLLRHVAEWSHDAPILLLCLARPELLDLRPVWGGGMLNATTVLLGPLTPEESGLLIADRLPSGAVEDAVRMRITEAAEGNPLFIEEMLAMLVEDGVVRQSDGQWVASADLPAIAVPPTIQALLAARLDGLGGDERAVLERASVEGKVFHRGSIQELWPECRNLDKHLGTLVRKELIRPDRSAIVDDEAFEFRHILIRDAAYESLPKETRADLHERFAAWLASTAGDHRIEYEEILAYHLEQAYRFRVELGRPDERSKELGRRAAGHLTAAGRRASAKSDAPAAQNLLSRAVVLLPEGEHARLELLVLYGRTLIEVGRLADADDALAEAGERAEELGERGLALHALVEREFLRLKTDPAGTTDEVRRVVERALRAFEELGDEPGLARSWDLLAQVHAMACRYRDRTHALKRALTHARRAGGEHEADILIDLGTALYWGPTPVAQAIAGCEELLHDAAAARPTVQAAVRGSLAGLLAMLGSFDEARALYRLQCEILDDLGLRYSFAAGTILYARIEMAAGDPAAAERELRGGYETLEEMGERGVLSTLAAYLADALYAQGRWDEADHYTRVSEGFATLDDVASQVWWRATRARVLARRGEHDEARAVVREALALAEPTDDLYTRGHLLLDAAEALRLGGADGEAAPLVKDAITLFTAKGDVVSAARARELL